MKATYTHNTAKNGIEIMFDSIPAQDIRDTLKENGFRWHRKNKIWYAKQTSEREELIKTICAAELKEETRQQGNKWGVKVGDIFHTSWGYEQTNNDFFQVVEVVGKQSVKVVAVNPEIIDRKGVSGMSEDRTYKITSELLPPAKSVFINDTERGDLKRLKDWGDDQHPCIIVGTSKQIATRVTGDTLTAYESWYA